MSLVPSRGRGRGGFRGGRGGMANFSAFRRNVNQQVQGPFNPSRFVGRALNRATRGAIAFVQRARGRGRGRGSVVDRGHMQHAAHQVQLARRGQEEKKGHTSCVCTARNDKGTAKITTIKLEAVTKSLGGTISSVRLMWTLPHRQVAYDIVMIVTRTNIPPPSRAAMVKAIEDKEVWGRKFTSTGGDMKLSVPLMRGLTDTESDFAMPHIFVATCTDIEVSIDWTYLKKAVDTDFNPWNADSIDYIHETE